MKVIYESRGGSTKKLAESMAGALNGVECWDLNAPEGVDISKIADGELIFLGSGAYFGSCGAKVKQFIKELAKNNKKVNLALFGCSFFKESAAKSMRRCANKNGYNPHGYTFSTKGKFLFLFAKRPNSQELNGAVGFAIRMTKS